MLLNKQPPDGAAASPSHGAKGKERVPTLKHRNITMAKALLAAAASAVIISCSGAAPTAQPKPSTQEHTPPSLTQTQLAEALRKTLLRDIAESPTNTRLPTATAKALPTTTPMAQQPPPHQNGQTQAPANTPGQGAASPTLNPTATAGETKTAPEDPAKAAIQLLYSLPWMKDGISRHEKELSRRLDALRRYNPELALRVTAMPFLRTHEPTDTGAVSALASISWHDPAAADRVASHPSLQGGITDEQTTSVALTHGEFLFGGEPTRVLGTGAPPFHTHTATLPLAGEILITIAARDGPERAAETATQVAQDLTRLEEFLAQPLRTANVLIHYGSDLPPAAKGANVQSSIMQLGHHHNQANYHWVQHELVHYWLNSNQGWLDEGMAQILTSLLNSQGTPSSLPATSPSCPESTKLRDLGPELPKNQVGSRCVYAVGERFMRTLYQEAGYHGFQEGARRLASLANQPPFQGMGLEQVREAFASTPAALKAAEDRWR